MRVSVVINTYNRAAALRTNLEGLRHQTYDDFEVIVVNGPSTDDTESVLREFEGRIRTVSCPEANLSKSRNIGIAAASGEIVAFIDDDAIAEPQWLAEIVAGFDSEQVAGVGGIVYDHTGYSLQYPNCVCSRRGSACWDLKPPLWGHQMPLADPFVYLPGGNGAYRRECLVEVGGFDEEIEYYLDEVSVCMRLTDAGYWLRPLNGAAIHHRSAPSHLRDAEKIIRKPFAIIKNRFYFALQNARADAPIDKILEECQLFADEFLQNARMHCEHGKLKPAQLAQFEEDVRKAIECGTQHGLHGKRRTIAIAAPQVDAFRRFPTLQPTQRRLTLCLVSQEMPPESAGGIGRFTLDLSQGFAAAGHEVHLITRSPDHNRVDFESGVWVHRLRSEADGRWAALAPTLRKNLSHAEAVHREILRIGKTRRIDLVSVPLWDCEGFFCLLDDSLRCVLSLQTSLKIVSDMHKSWHSPEMDQLLAIERQTVRSARYVHSISHSILDRVRRDYGAPVEPAEAFVVPLGIVDRSREFQPQPADGRVRVLFVGRLEKRKGVDLLLDAAIQLAREYPNLEVIFAGNDAIPSEEGPTYRAAFQKRYAADPAAAQVVFKGQVAEDELYQLYADCDIFCLPARYESFGLVLVEAMMFSKPVVGMSAGGMKEIVDHGVNGFLADPEDRDSLLDSLARLIDSEALRQEFGRQSRRRYESLFSLERMIENTQRAYEAIIDGVPHAAASGVEQDAGRPAGQGRAAA